VAFNTREARATIVIEPATPRFSSCSARAAPFATASASAAKVHLFGVQTISRKAEWPDWHPPAK